MKGTGGRENVAILGLGLCTPLGLSAPETQAAIHAGIAVFSASDALDVEGEPLPYSALSLLDTELTRTERIALLSVRALVDTFSHARTADCSKTTMFLGLPEQNTGAPVKEDRLIEELTNAAAPYSEINVPLQAIHRGGRAAFFQCIASALSYLESHSRAVVLIGAMDSLCDEVSLNILSEQNRVLARSNRDGLIPGEGAGFVLLKRADLTNGQEGHPRIVACALGFEPRHFKSEKADLADGLTSVFRELRLLSSNSRRTDFVLSCQTGETFWAEEFVKAYLRNEPLFPEPLRTTLIAESLGDIGAGAGAVQLGVALHKLKRFNERPREPKRALIYGCSDSGAIGACVVENT